MGKPLAIALLVLGVVLLVFGVQASHSAASTISHAVTGTPTDKSMYLIGGGVLSAILGFIGLARS